MNQDSAPTPLVHPGAARALCLQGICAGITLVAAAQLSRFSRAAAVEAAVTRARPKPLCHVSGRVGRTCDAAGVPHRLRVLACGTVRRLCAAVRAWERGASRGNPGRGRILTDCKADLRTVLLPTPLPPASPSTLISRPVSPVSLSIVGLPHFLRCPSLALGLTHSHFGPAAAPQYPPLSLRVGVATAHRDVSCPQPGMALRHPRPSGRRSCNLAASAPHGLNPANRAAPRRAVACRAAPCGSFRSGPLRAVAVEADDSAGSMLSRGAGRTRPHVCRRSLPPPGQPLPPLPPSPPVCTQRCVSKPLRLPARGPIR